MDGNLHAGDPNQCNTYGKLFKEFLVKYQNLTVVNGTNLCENVITRRRVANGKMEEAALNFYVVYRKTLLLIIKMEIDDMNKLVWISKKKTVESDHCPVYLRLNNYLPKGWKFTMSRIKNVLLYSKRIHLITLNLMPLEMT